MSKHIIYRCDYCQQTLSDEFKQIEEKHLSINFAGYSGWVEKTDGKWSHKSYIKGIKHFCNAGCLGHFLHVLRKDIKE